MIRRLVVLLALLVTAVVVLGSFFPALPQHVVTNAMSVSKLVSLALGAVFSRRCVRSFDAGVMRSAWRMMTAWFALFFVGQLILATYELIDGVAPVPSLGDLFFLGGYVAVSIATLQFVVGYGATGFALGTRRDHAPSLVLWTVLFAWIGVVALAPAARAPLPLATRLVNVTYPILDFLLLVPVLLLLRMTFAFRGGRVWTVWATLLFGIVFFTAGDILFAIPTASTRLVSLLTDVGFLLGYAFAASGAGLNAALLRD